jgi:hypothetical protein
MVFWNSDCRASCPSLMTLPRPAGEELIRIGNPLSLSAGGLNVGEVRSVVFDALVNSD